MPGDTAGTDIQVGLVSFGATMCTDPNEPAVFTRISSYIDFIQDGICALSSNPPDYCKENTVYIPIEIPPGANITRIYVPNGLNCFSGDTKIETETRGRIPMRDLEVGEKVLSASNKYERVYSFGHRDVSTKAEFLHFHPSKLEVTENHLVFIDGQQGAVPASTIKVGDILSGIKVEGVRKVVREGVYNPFTPSGTIVVNEILASNYIALQESNGAFQLGTWTTGLSFHWLEHAFQFPHRVWCHWLGMRDTTLPSGLSSWSEGPYKAWVWLLGQNEISIGLLMVPLILTLCVFVAAESMMFNPLLAAVLVVGFISVRRNGKN